MGVQLVRDHAIQLFLKVQVMRKVERGLQFLNRPSVDRFNPESYLVRLLLLALMLTSLVLSAVISESFGDQSLLFAGMYVLIQVGRNLAAFVALHGHKLQRNFTRILSWFLLTAVLWLVGGALGGTTRNILWGVAIVLEYISAAAGFYVPGIGKSVTTDWDIRGGHLAGKR
jgi:low temperature requirement protein LtrA